MKSPFCLLFAIVIISGCRKEEEPQGPATHISGIVRDISTGEPVPGANITLSQVFGGDTTGGGPVMTEYHYIRNFTANQKGEFSYTYTGTKERLAIDVVKVGYFNPEIIGYYNIRYHEQNNLTVEMEKAAILNLHLKNVTNTIDSFRVSISGWGVTDMNGDYPHSLRNYNEGTEKYFRLYVKGNDSLDITGWHDQSHSGKRVYRNHLLTLPGQEYEFTIEY